MFFSKKIVIPAIILLALTTYYTMQAPNFTKNTSAFAIWAKSVVEPASKNKPQSKKIDLSIKATESSQSKALSLKAHDDESSKQLLRLITLCVESGFNFQEGEDGPQGYNDGWIIQIEDPRTTRQFYALVSYDELKNSAAGLNLIQLMHMWGK